MNFYRTTYPVDSLEGSPGEVDLLTGSWEPFFLVKMASKSSHAPLGNLKINRETR